MISDYTLFLAAVYLKLWPIDNERENLWMTVKIHFQAVVPINNNLDSYHMTIQWM